MRTSTLLVGAVLCVSALNLNSLVAQETEREMRLAVTPNKAVYRFDEPMLLNARFEGDPQANIAVSTEGYYFYLVCELMTDQHHAWSAPIWEMQFVEGSKQGDHFREWLCGVSDGLERQLVVYPAARGRVTFRLQPGTYRMRLGYSINRNSLQDLILQRTDHRVEVDGILLLRKPDDRRAYNKPLLSEPFLIRVVEGDSGEKSEWPLREMQEYGSELPLRLAVRPTKKVCPLDEPLLLEARFEDNGLARVMLSDRGSGSAFFYLILDDDKEVLCVPVWKLQFVETPAEMKPDDRNMCWLWKVRSGVERQLVVWKDAPGYKLPLKPGDCRMRIGYSIYPDRLSDLIFKQFGRRVKVEPSGPPVSQEAASVGHPQKLEPYDKPLLSEPFSVHFFDSSKRREKPKPPGNENRIGPIK